LFQETMEEKVSKERDIEAKQKGGEACSNDNRNNGEMAFE